LTKKGGSDKKKKNIFDLKGEAREGLLVRHLPGVFIGVGRLNRKGKNVKVLGGKPGRLAEEFEKVEK